MKNVIIREGIEIVTVAIMKGQCHAMKNVGTRGEIEIFMIVVTKKHVAKNVGSRAEIEIFIVAVVKRHVTKNIGLRGKIEIYMATIRAKIVLNSQRNAQDQHGYGRDKDPCEVERRDYRDIYGCGYDETGDKNYFEHKRRDQDLALHGCANEKAHDESCDDKRN